MQHVLLHRVSQSLESIGGSGGKNASGVQEKKGKELVVIVLLFIV